MSKAIAFYLAIGIIICSFIGLLSGCAEMEDTDCITRTVTGDRNRHIEVCWEDNK